MDITSRLTEYQKKEVQAKVIKALEAYNNCLFKLSTSDHPNVTQQFTLDAGGISHGSNSKTERFLEMKEEYIDYVNRMINCINALKEVDRTILILFYIKNREDNVIVQKLEYSHNLFLSSRTYYRKKRNALLQLGLHLKYVEEELDDYFEEVSLANL